MVKVMERNCDLSLSTPQWRWHSPAAPNQLRKPPQAVLTRRVWRCNAAAVSPCYAGSPKTSRLGLLRKMCFASCLTCKLPTPRALILNLARCIRTSALLPGH